MAALCQVVSTELYFYPRSPCGERQKPSTFAVTEMIISIHALLAESDAFDVLAASAALISIHALLAESDVASVLEVGGSRYFYPRSPCGERLLQF